MINQHQLDSGLVNTIIAQHSFERDIDVIYGTKAMKASPSKDPLIVEKGPMTRSRAKRVKEAMELIAQATVDETLIKASKSTSFMLIQATNGRFEHYYYATA